MDPPSKSRQGSILAVFGFFGVKPVALQVVLTLPQQRLHYLPRLLPIPPTYKLNGSSFGRPDVDLIFAKWAFNNVCHFTQSYTKFPCVALGGGAER